MNLVGVLLWPLGWALAALVTQGILDFMTDPSFEYIDPTSTLPDLQKTIGVAVVGFWIIFSTVAAPVIIQNVMAHGIQPGGALLAAASAVFSRPPPRLRALPRPLPAPAFLPSPLARRA